MLFCSHGEVPGLNITRERRYAGPVPDTFHFYRDMIYRDSYLAGIPPKYATHNSKSPQLYNPLYMEPIANRNSPYMLSMNIA